jgi:hypothetical protein
MGHAAEFCAPPARTDGYARRRPELTTLHRTLSAHWPALVEQAEAAGGLPSFDELRRASTSFDELRRASTSFDELRRAS